MTGLINTSGILTNAVPGTLPSNTTYVDYFLDSINLLRIGPALAEADQVWIHPTTWRSVVKVKDGLGRYLVTPDPTRDPANQIFGINVHTTTAMPLGTAVILDSTKWGYCIVREGLTIISGHNQADFSQNIQRYVVEERVQIAVTRPSAVLTLTGLPTS
jgi:HK97 family phage major capsid protein